MPQTIHLRGHSVDGVAADSPETLKVGVRDADIGEFILQRPLHIVLLLNECEHPVSLVVTCGLGLLLLFADGSIILVEHKCEG